MSVTAGYMALQAILPLMLRMMTAPVPARSGMMPAARRIPESDTRPPACGLTLWPGNPPQHESVIGQ